MSPQISMKKTLKGTTSNVHLLTKKSHITIIYHFSFVVIFILYLVGKSSKISSETELFMAYKETEIPPQKKYDKEKQTGAFCC